MDRGPAAVVICKTLKFHLSEFAVIDMPVIDMNGGSLFFVIDFLQ